MKRRIDPVAIASVASYVENQKEELKSMKNKLLTDISKISNAYHGNDATNIINKYQNRVNSLDTIITNYENYALYMKKISGAYDNNLNESKKNLNNVLEDINVNQESNILPNLGDLKDVDSTNNV